MPTWKIKGHYCFFKVGDISKYKKAHIHIEASRGEISFWISENNIKLKAIDGHVNPHEKNKIAKIIEENKDFFLKEWEKEKAKKK